MLMNGKSCLIPIIRCIEIIDVNLKRQPYAMRHLREFIVLSEWQVYRLRNYLWYFHPNEALEDNHIQTKGS